MSSRLTFSEHKSTVKLGPERNVVERAVHDQFWSAIHSTDCLGYSDIDKTKDAYMI